MTSNPVLLDEVCDSSHLGSDLHWHSGVKGSCPTLLSVCDPSHLGIDQDDLVPEVETTSNNVVVPESLMQLDDAQLGCHC